MTRNELLKFLRKQRHGVIATVAPDGEPQAALVGIAFTDQLELIFDTVGTSRKWKNLKKHSRIAVVIGGFDGSEITVQLEGVADEPQGVELDRLKEEYFKAYPDGRERQSWQGITYLRVKPKWIRYSDFNPNGAIVEFTEGEL